MRLARLIKLLRGSVAERGEIAMEANENLMFGVDLARVLFLLFGITHLAACLWYSIGARDVEAPKVTWIQEYVEQGRPEEYTWSSFAIPLYLTLTTMTTVGYGDILALNLVETLLVAGLLLVASIVFASLMGTLTNLIHHINSAKHIRNESKAKLSRYTKWRAVPNQLFLPIRRHILFLLAEYKGYDSHQEEIKAQLPPTLKAELTFHINGGLLHGSPFLWWMRDCGMPEEVVHHGAGNNQPIAWTLTPACCHLACTTPSPPPTPRQPRPTVPTNHDHTSY